MDKTPRQRISFDLTVGTLILNPSARSSPAGWRQSAVSDVPIEASDLASFSPFSA